MTPNDMLKEAMSLAKVNQKELQRRMNLKGQSSISTYLKSDIRISTFVKLLAVMGFSVKVEGYGREWEITPELPEPRRSESSPHRLDIDKLFSK